MLADSPVCAYAVKQTSGQLALAGDIYDSAPYGYVLPQGPRPTSARPSPVRCRTLIADGDLQDDPHQVGRRGRRDHDARGQPALPEPYDSEMTPARARPEPIKAVPVRHPGRWVGTAVIVVLAAMFVHLLVTNKHVRAGASSSSASETASAARCSFRRYCEGSAGTHRC